MQFSSSQQALPEIDCDLMVMTLGTAEEGQGQIDSALWQHVQALREAGIINTKVGAVNWLPAPPGAARALLVMGSGKNELSPAQFRNLWESAGRTIRERSFGTVAIAAGPPPAGRDHAFATRQIILGFAAGHYRYEATVSLKGDAAKPVDSITIAGADEADVREAAAVAIGTDTSRELGNLPPNLLNPKTLAERAAELADQYVDATAEIIEHDVLERMGMGALCAVGRGSSIPPRLIVLKYLGADDEQAPPVALVGKGITFDTGGISLKPGAKMDEMKFDMCGAAGVIGAFQACCELQLKLNVIAVVPAVENMPDGNAYRPGDVVKTLSGKTVEVLNTDAEGRLILCDALTYVQRFNPSVVVDAATLTGACVIALGQHASGLMSKDDELADQLLAAGDAIFDRAWRLPLWDEYENQLDSNFADFSNLGGPPAGSITAGCFLGKFCDGVRWAHLDVAGSAWTQGANKGATGRPAALLSQFLIDQAREG